jgi:penicillin-binding protein 1B
MISFFLKIAFLLIVGLSSLIGYFSFSINNLIQAFDSQAEWTPSRVYSDLSTISLADPRKEAEELLNRLGYPFHSQTYQIDFQMNTSDYPAELNPKTYEKNQILNVEIHFDGDNTDASVESIRINDQDETTLFLKPELIAILSRNGESRSIRTNKKFEDIPSLLWQAIIAIEDQSFLTHPGLDLKGLLRAIYVNLKTLSFAQGGSTITQQLVKNLTSRRKKNLFLKLNEAFLALSLEMKYSKQSLLERYLNEVYLGQVGKLEVHGVVEGAQFFFGKQVEDLSLGEIAIIAGLIRGPHYYSPYKNLARCKKRQKIVLEKMVETSQITQMEADEAFSEPIRTVPPQNVVSKAPFFTDTLQFELKPILKNLGMDDTKTPFGLNIYTSLNTRFNGFAQSAITKGLLEAIKKNPEAQKLESALIAIDHKKGLIKTIIGGKSYTESSFNRAINSKRQVGSVFKPIVYLSAILKGKDDQGIPYGPAHLVLDAPWTLNYDNDRQSWSPKNIGKNYKGWITYRTALAESVNVAAAKVGWEVGLDRIIAVANSLGIKSSLLAVPSLALGTSELTPLEMTSCYATIANHGTKNEIGSIKLITDNTQKLLYERVQSSVTEVDPSAVDLLIDMLQDVFTKGTAQNVAKMNFEHIAAGKTGTTSSYRDAWLIGFTKDITVGVWVGFDQNITSNLKITGAAVALPIWVDFVKSALQNQASSEFDLNPKLIDLPTNVFSGKKATSDCKAPYMKLEKYIQDILPEQEACEKEFPLR